MLSWTPEPQVFPSGTADWLGMPTFLHARYLDITNDYRKNPELGAEMICEAERDVEKNAGGICLPLGKKVFEQMMGGVQGWRPFVYEQDWIVTHFQKSQALTNRTDVGELWTSGMNDAAMSFNMSIQFSMSVMPAILQSSKMQAVTQIRGSTDYTAGSDQWMLGVQSSFYYALGAVASKDTFWTTKHQPGCPKAGDYNCTEPNVELQVIIATLSGGPVGPGDRLGMTDRSLAMRSCNEDGRILRPTFPLAALDRAVTGPAEKTLWSAYSSFTGIAAGFHFVFYAREESMRITPSDLLVVCSNTTLGARRCHEGGAGAVDDEEFVAVSITQTGGVWPAVVELQTVSETKPLLLSPPKAPEGSAGRGVVPFSYVMLAPNAARGLGGSSWVILGELDKVVPVSPGRFGAATASSAGLTWEVKGAVGEVVTISYTRAGTLALRTVQCTMDAMGRGVLMCDTDQCHC